ncbi:MAG TPA: hypothetical protein DD383_01780 [Rikenellaceae bacterium]|nr:hypothetical protein [Rikenellaceae bacterium]
MIKKFFIALAVALAFGLVASAQGYKGPELTPEFVCDLGKLTPKNVKVKGATQGFAIHGKYGFVLHDKGQCVVIDMKKNKFVSTFMLEGNTSHCNNASFGVEKGTKFPLLYISGCKGDHCCYVTDITLDGGRIVQKIFHSGEGYTGSFDWFIDRKNKIIYTYGSCGDMRKLVKKFKLPELADSDTKGEVHLTQADVLEEFPIEGIRIYQGSVLKGRYAYLGDGYPPHDRLLHVLDMDAKKLVKTVNLNDLQHEPEGVDIKGKWLYMVLHVSKQPRDGQIYRFRIR